MNKVVAVLKDVLFVDSGDPWNPNPANVSKVMKMLEGIHKVLKQDGVYRSPYHATVAIESSKT